jgi:hypothetical protein
MPKEFLLGQRLVLTRLGRLLAMALKQTLLIELMGEVI